MHLLVQKNARRRGLLALLVLITGALLLTGRTDPTRSPLASSLQSFAAHAAPVLNAVSTPAAPDLAPLRADLQAYLLGQDGTWGFYLIDLNSGAETGFNQDLIFPSASTLKLPLAMYILDLASRGEVDLQEQVAYQTEDWEGGAGSLQALIGEGDALSVARLVELAITESDNIAANMLYRRFGYANLYGYMRSLGGTVTHYTPERNGTTPREMAGYMYHLAAERSALDPALRRFLVDALERTVFTDRIPAGLPQGVRVGNKVGTLDFVVNDVGYAMTPGKGFVLAVFSMDTHESWAPGVIAEVARRSYLFLSEE